MLKEKDRHQSCKEESELIKKYLKQLEYDRSKKVRHTSPKDYNNPTQNRNLKDLKTRAQKAFHFCTLFGLKLDSLKLKDPEGFQTNAVAFNAASQSSPLVSKSTRSTPLVYNASDNCNCPSSSPATPPHGNSPVIAAITSSSSSRTESPPNLPVGLQLQTINQTASQEYTVLQTQRRVYSTSLINLGLETSLFMS